MPPHTVGPVRSVHHRHLLGTLVLVLFTGAAMSLAGPVPAAQAHARLVATVPKEAGVVDPATAEVRLIFNELVTPVADGFSVYDSAGEARSASAHAIDTDVRITLPAGLDRGSYLLTWRVFSGDGHVIAGTLTFGYGESYRPISVPTGVGPADTAVTAVAGAVQVTAYLSLLLMAGLVWFTAAVVRGDGGLADPAGRIRRIVLWAAAAVALAATAMSGLLTQVIDRAQGLPGLGRADVWSDAFGWPGIGPLLLVLVGTAGVVVTGAPGERATRLGRRLAAVLAATVALSSLALGGHSRTEPPVWLAMTADLVHVTAAAGWLGGIVGLALTLRERSREVSGTRQAAILVARFSALAAVLVASLAASGFALGVLILPSAAALITTGYGVALLVKLALVAVVAVLALWNRARLLPQVAAAPREEDRWHRLRGAVRDEALILLAIICTTGVLVSLSPNEGGAASRPVTAAATFDGSLGGGASMTGSVTPGRVGDNVVELTLRNADGSLLSPTELPDIEAILAEPAIGPIEATVTELTPGRYRAALRLAAAGRWDVEVSVRTGDQERASIRTSLDVRT